MKNKSFTVSALLALALLLAPPHMTPAVSAQAASEPQADWAWLKRQVDEGATSVVLPGSIVCDEEEGLSPADVLTIEGNGFTLTGVLLDGGTVIFKDVLLMGVHGLEEESGGAALTLRGEGAVAVLSGGTRAVGGRSGPAGQQGGDGVRLAGKDQGVILRNKAVAVGGTGYLYGGAGVRVEGCGGSALLADDAACIGGMGLAEGGAGFRAPGCASAVFKDRTAADGGASAYAGGHGVHSLPCQACEGRGAVELMDQAMLTSGKGEDGGSGVWIERESPGERADLSLSGACLLMGGNGVTAGPALRAAGCALAFSGEPSCYAGAYYTTAAPALLLADCVQTGGIDPALQFEGEALPSHPASDVALAIRTTLAQISSRRVPVPVEGGLTTRELFSKYQGLTVERGRVSRASINGGNLMITLWNGTLEKRLDFTMRLSGDGGEGARLAIIAVSSQEWVTLEASVAALAKLSSLGVTQLAVTSVEPVYYERILDIAAVLAAVEADEKPVEAVYFGTADDCVIFRREDGAKDYQETLMKEILRPLEPLEPPEPEGE